ncbi:MAG: histidine--tRNA ligase [Deltaproteobacteria bacterium RIFOXYA12_FULL_61_11]|nr:MAG: histidine--tRNA ligase [Deltaproteobacteria bacterium RIFOXYA12_FULL_61_11]
MQYTRLKGMTDLYGEDLALWQAFEVLSRKVLERFGYREIRTPLLEMTELFQRGLGEDSDVVQKEMYTFPDRKGRSLTVRPEGTASVVRAVLENNMLHGESLLKLFYLGPMYRYERPQKGRLRQFHQLGAECLGAAGPEVDAETIHLLAVLLNELGLTEYQVRLNSIGCSHCRPAFHRALTDYYHTHAPELCADCTRRLSTNPLRLLDCKVPGCAALRTGAPLVTNFHCSECAEHYLGLQRLLNRLEVSHSLEPSLVRGLDYYVRTVFEFVSGDLGAQDSILGGGRYDRLVGEFGGPDLPAIGFAIGVERLVMLLRGKLPPREVPTEYYGIALDPTSRELMLETIGRLRLEGCPADLDHRGGSLKAQLKRAAHRGAHYALILGPDECQRGVVVCRDLQASSQLELPLADLPDHFRKS